MKKLALLIFVTSLTSCGIDSNQLYTLKPRNNDIANLNFTYNHDLDFKKGKWLVGDIDVNADAKDDLTVKVQKDFSGYLGERVRYAVNERSLLLATKIPLNPNKKEIENLKKGTGCDYFINIKSKDSATDLSNFNYTEHNYFKAKMVYVDVVLEIYDLNSEEIIYSQAAHAEMDKYSTITTNLVHNLTIGCYDKIMKYIVKNSIAKTK